jgi:hypothetical protein
MAKSHPVRNSQFMMGIRDVHSFFKDESFKIRNNQQVVYVPARMLALWRMNTGSMLKMILHLVPVELRGSQNKFPSPPTPFETRGRNVTACPANICCSQSGTSITEMLLEPSVADAV